LKLTLEEVIRILSPEQKKEVLRRIAEGERFEDFVEVQARLFDENTDIKVLKKKGSERTK
jgi:hypothetical protein